MAMNIYNVKKTTALLLPSIMTTTTFFILITFVNLLWAIVGLIGMMLLMLLVGNLMLKNPFSAMLEGKGILCLNLDSTGIIRPFIMNVQNYYLKGKLMGKQTMDIFNRDCVQQIARPIKTITPAIQHTEKGELIITLTEEDYNKSRFSMLHYPCILYNDQLETLITKDFISQQEKQIFAEHKILYLNRKLEELTSITRDFARYVVELTKPKEGLFANKWIWFIIIGIIVLVVGFLAIKFLPGIFGQAKTAVGNTVGAVSGAAVRPAG
jgi:hypothetical protein